MKAKTIKMVLRKKLNDWIEVVKKQSKLTDESDFIVNLKRDVIVTGGAISAMLMDEDVNDYDIYFKTQETTLAMANHYVKIFEANPPPSFKKTGKKVQISVKMIDGRVRVYIKSAGIAGESWSDEYQYFESVPDETTSQAFIDKTMEAAKEKVKPTKEYKPVFMTSNAISLTDDIQMVIRFYGPVDEIHKNFDYVHCTCSYDYAKNELILPTAALESMLAKELKYQSSKYPLCSIIRSRKFIQRGWKINAGQFVKMAWELHQLDLANIEVLEDQLLGVDSAYFTQVIALLKGSNNEEVDGTYLMQIIDEVF